jgi:hypothetical protein
MIAPGTILIEQGTRLPEPLRFEPAPHAGGWGTVANLAEKLESAGWTFFFMAGEIKSSGFGDAALRRLIASAKRQKCNCLEIDGVSERSFLGIPYVSMTAHWRHIQKGYTFQSRDREGAVSHRD